MGQAEKLRKSRAIARELAGELEAPKAGKYAGASFWRILVSVIWPGVLVKPRAKAQEALDWLHAKGIKRASKRVAHKMAKENT